MYRDALPEPPESTPEEIERDRLIRQYIIQINKRLTVTDSADFIADRMADGDDRWALLATCRAWAGRVGIPDIEERILLVDMPRRNQEAFLAFYKHIRMTPASLLCAWYWLE